MIHNLEICSRGYGINYMIRRKMEGGCHTLLYISCIKILSSCDEYEHVHYERKMNIIFYMMLQRSLLLSGVQQ